MSCRSLSPIQYLNKRYGTDRHGSLLECCTLNIGLLTLSTVFKELVEPVRTDAAKKSLVFCSFITLGEASFSVSGQRTIYYSAEKAPATAQVWSRDNGPNT